MRAGAEKTGGAAGGAAEWKGKVWLPLLILVLTGLLCPFAGAAPECRSGVSAAHADGIVARIVARLAQRLDLPLVMRQAPFARRLRWMETGEIDLMGGLLRRPEREAYICYISPPYVTENRKIFYVRKGEENRIQCYEDLYGLVIGTSIHSRYFPRFDRDRRLIKEPVSNVESNFKKLLAGRIDTVIYSNRSGHETLLEMGIVDKVSTAAYGYTGTNPVYIGISRQSPLMRQKDRIEAVVRRMVESGEIASIIDAYYRELPSTLRFQNRDGEEELADP